VAIKGFLGCTAIPVTLISWPLKVLYRTVFLYSKDFISYSAYGLVLSSGGYAVNLILDVVLFVFESCSLFYSYT
jgi:hypothetical protein